MDRAEWMDVLFDLHDRNTHDWDDLTIAERLTVLDFLAIHRRDEGDPDDRQ